MPDAVPTPTPAPTPAPAPDPKSTRSVVNQGDLADLKDARSVAQTAQQAQYAAVLAEKEITQADVTALLADIDDAETKKAPGVVTADNAKKIATAAEEKAKQALMAVLREMQGAVKRKFERTDTSKLPAYFIAKRNFGDDRKGLETDAQAMLDQAATDALPGFTPAKLGAAVKLLADWIKADDLQQDAEKKVGQARTDFKTAVDSIRQRTRGIRLAANAGWPHTDPANAATRRAFNLPTDRPLK